MCSTIGCKSWIYNDRAERLTACNQCGKLWDTTLPMKSSLKHQHRIQAWADWNFSKKGSKWPKTWKDALVAPPPGLGSSHRNFGKTEKAMMTAIEKAWEHLGEDIRKELQKAGINHDKSKKEDDTLETLCVKHAAALPESIRQFVMPTTQPKTQEQMIKETTGKFKLQTQELRELIQQKVGLQIRIDKAKQTYQTLLQDMQKLSDDLNAKQKSVEDLQKELHATINTEPSESDPTTDFLKILGDCGVSLSDEQRTSLKSKIEQGREDAIKKRKLEPSEQEAAALATSMQQG